MNIPAIKRNCVRKKRFEIIDDMNGGQWIGNGQAWWAVEGITIGENSIADLFDLNDKQVDKCLITRTASNDRRFRRCIGANEGSAVCDDMGAVWFNGWLMRCIYHTNYGTMFLLVDNLKPAAADDEYCNYYALKDDGDILIAVYNGFFCTAIVKPVDGNLPELIVDRLRRIVDAPLFVPNVPTLAEAAAEALAEQMEIGAVTVE